MVVGPAGSRRLLTLWLLMRGGWACRKPPMFDTRVLMRGCWAGRKSTMFGTRVFNLWLLGRPENADFRHEGVCCAVFGPAGHDRFLTLGFSLRG